MGVDIKISLYAPTKVAANKGFKAAFARFEILNDLFTDYDNDSELMRLCREGPVGVPIVVSEPLFDILRRSEELSKLTDGAFDVTAGALVRQWRRARFQQRLPKPKNLVAAREVTGYSLLKLDPKHRTVTLGKPKMRLDLGGIAKGYAADDALKALRKMKLSRAMIDAGGDLVLGDPPPDRAGWEIAIASLRNPETQVTRVVRVKNCGLANSGDAYQFVVIDGTRYSHIVDPRTGLGLTERSAVTVIAPDGATADALASGFSVLGPKRGSDLCGNLKGVTALFVTLNPDDDSKICVQESKGFPSAIEEQAD